MFEALLTRFVGLEVDGAGRRPAACPLESDRRLRARARALGVDPRVTAGPGTIRSTRDHLDDPYPFYARLRAPARGPDRGARTRRAARGAARRRAFGAPRPHDVPLRPRRAMGAGRRSRAPRHVHRERSARAHPRAPRGATVVHAERDGRAGRRRRRIVEELVDELRRGRRRRRDGRAGPAASRCG